MQFQKHFAFGVSTVCCFCLMLSLFSSTAFAAEAGGSANFAELCGWELADGESKWVDFNGGGASPSTKVTNATTVDDFVKTFNAILQNYGLTFSYNKASGQFAAVDKDGNNIDFVLSSDGEEFFKSPSPASPAPSGNTTMSQLLSTITEVFATSAEWIMAVSNVIVANPILLLIVVISFIGTGVLLFKRFLNL